MGAVDLTNPAQVRKASNGDSEWSDEDQIYSPGSHNNRDKSPV